MNSSVYVLLIYKTILGIPVDNIVVSQPLDKIKLFIQPKFTLQYMLSQTCHLEKGLILS